MLTREAAEKALPSLLGMAVDYRQAGRHDARADRAADGSEPGGAAAGVSGYSTRGTFRKWRRPSKRSRRVNGHELRVG